MNQKMRKPTSITLILAGLLFICPGISQAHGVNLLGVIFKLQGTRDEAAIDIQKYNKEIQKNNIIIIKAKQIINLAQQKDNLRAEGIAQQALMNAEEARQKNQELKDRAELREKRADMAYSHVYNLLSENLGSNSKIKGFVTNYSGHVSILSKRLGETIPLGNNRAGYLEPGDEILTYGNSSAEMQFLDGRGTMKLGEYSQLNIGEDRQGKQIINVLKGKIYIGIDKLDDYQKMMEEKIRRYKSDAGLVKDELIGKMVDKYEGILDRYKKVKSGEYQDLSAFGTGILGLTPLIRTPCAVFGVRGTKFLIFENEKLGTELIVLRGVVDVKAIKGKESASVGAGHRIRATKDGVISKSEKIDLKELKRWWEK